MWFTYVHSMMMWITHIYKMMLAGPVAKYEQEKQRRQQWNLWDETTKAKYNFFLQWWWLLGPFVCFHLEKSKLNIGNYVFNFITIFSKVPLIYIISCSIFEQGWEQRERLLQEVLLLLPRSVRCPVFDVLCLMSCVFCPVCPILLIQCPPWEFHNISVHPQI